MNVFKIKDENNVERDATLVTVIECDEKKYAVYSIVRDSENTNIFVSRLEYNSEGKGILLDINDENEKNKLKQIIQNIIKLPIVGDE